MRNKKGFSPLIASILLIIFLIVLILISKDLFSDECSQKDIENGYCECTEKEEIGVSKEGNYCKTPNEECEPLVDWHIKNGWKCDISTKLTYSCERCIQYSPKSECQLKLEKEGILGEDCICEKYEDKINIEWIDKCCTKLGNWTIKSNSENDQSFKLGAICYDASEKYYYEIDGINIEECNKVNQYIKKCIKSRESTECEKGNPEYILDSCFKLKTITEEGIPITLEVADKKNTAISSITLNKKVEWKCIEGGKCRKKTFEDLTCEELDYHFEENKNYCNDKKIGFFCFPGFNWKDRVDFLKRMLELKCL